MRKEKTIYEVSYHGKDRVRLSFDRYDYETMLVSEEEYGDLGKPTVGDRVIITVERIKETD